MGCVNYERTEVEKENVKFRRSLYAVEDIQDGQLLTEDNIKSIRPGFGLAPKHFDQVLGMRSIHYIPRGTALKFDMLKKD